MFGELIEIKEHDNNTLPPQDVHVLLKRQKDGTMYVGYLKKYKSYVDGSTLYKWYQPTARTSRQAGMKPSHWMYLPE